jgi:two-component system sensor histidine kinase SenX3
MQDDPTRPDMLMFLASAAHDMKNSIGMLSGTLEAVLRDPAVQAMPAYRQMAHMLYETRRMNDNLMQLLTLYREVGRPSYPFDPQPQAVAEFVETIEAQHRVLLEAKDIAFEADYPPELVWCFDEDLVAGVVGHALNNAIHYTGDKIRLIVRPAGEFLEIRVEDNGRGFPAAMLEAGTAIDSGVDFTTGSTGLGLYFSSEVAKAHKHRGRRGSIALENGGSCGGGCFVLRLP